MIHQVLDNAFRLHTFLNRDRPEAQLTHDQFRLQVAAQMREHHLSGRPELPPDDQ